MNINLTIIGQIVAFAFFAWFCMKFVWPPVIQALEERKKKIADGLAAADRAEKDLELAQNKATQQLKEGKDKAAEFVDAAQKRANQILEEANTERTRIIAAAKKQAEAEAATVIGKAKDELRGQVATLVLSGAEKILEKEINESVHSELVAKLATQL